MRGTHGVASSTADGERSLAPVVAIILLFAAVFMGAILVAVTGSMLVDALEADAEVEQTRSVADDGNSCLQTVAFADGACGVTMNPSGTQSMVTDDGTMNLTWSDGTDEESVENIRLGAIEHRRGDRTIVLQSGGVWEVHHDDNASTVRSPPDIRYETVGGGSDTLKLDVLTVSGDDYTGRDATARLGDDPHGYASQIEEASRSGLPNVTIEVQSAYYDAWYEHFEDAFDHENATVTRDDAARTVTVEITDVWVETPEPYFAIERDEGIRNNEDHAVNGSAFQIDATIENVGDEGDVRTLRAVLLNPDGAEIENTNPVSADLDPGESESVMFNFNAASYKDELEPGRVYEYTIRTGDDELQPRGTFYYGSDDEGYAVTDVDVSDPTPEGEFDVSATIWNRGVDNDTEMVGFRLEHADDPDKTDDYDDVRGEIEVGREIGAEADVTWTLNASELYDGNHTFTVRTEDGDEEWVEFTVDNGVPIDADEGDITLPEGGEVTISVLGTETSLGHPAENVDDGLESTFDIQDDIDELRAREGLSDHDMEKTYVQDLVPIEVGVVAEDRDTGTREQVDMPWDGENLNTWENRREYHESYTGTAVFDPNTRLSVTATSFFCDDRVVADADEYGEGQVYPDADYYWDVYDGNGDWYHFDCAEPGAEWLRVDATTDSSPSNVQVRSAEDNTLPELRGFHPRQFPSDEVLGEHGLYVDEDAEIELGEHEFVFLFEVTRENADFENAYDVEGPGDPNYNDVIVHVYIDPYTEGADPDYRADAGDAGADATDGTGPGAPRSPGGPGTPDFTNVEASATHVVVE